MSMRKKAILIPIVTLVTALVLWAASVLANAAQSVENIQSDNLDAQMQVVLDAVSQKDFAKADAALDQTLKRFAGHKEIAKTLYKVAGKYNFAGKRARAKELYELSCGYAPDDMYAQLSQLYCDVRNGHAEAADIQLTSILEIHADDTSLPEEIFYAGVNMGYAGEHEYAIQLYRQLLDTYPDANHAPYATMRMAMEYSKLGDEENADIAIESLKNDFGDFPKKAENFWKLGQYYRLDNNMYDKAAELYGYGAENCTKADDHTMYCQVELVKYYIRTGDFSEGDEQYNKLIDEFKDNPNLASNICFIGDTYLRADEVDIAKLLYNNVLNKWPDDPQAIFAKAGLAKIAAHLGQDTAVNQIIDEIFKNYADNPDIAKAIFGIGQEYWQQGFDRKWKGVIQGDSNEDSSDYVVNKISNAIIVWEKLINNIPNSQYAAESTFMIGDAYRDIGEYGQAIEYYTNLVDNWPQHENAWIAQDRIISLYRQLKSTGNITKSEGDILILDAQEKLLQQFPDCPIVENITRDMLYIKNRQTFNKAMAINKIRNLLEKQKQEGGSK